MLALLISTYIRPVTISDSREVKKPEVIDSASQTARSEITQGYLWVAPTPSLVLFFFAT